MRRHDDEGYTLVEVLVAAGLMGVVMAVALTAVLQIYSSVDQTDETVTVRDSIDVSFRRLDREMRYATWASTPAQVGGRWYLEYALPAPAGVDYGTRHPCRQLKLENGVLTLASWDLPSATPANPFIIASGVAATNGPVEFYTPKVNPYATAATGAGGVGTAYVPQYLQFRLKFTVKAGKVTLPFDSVFTAQNIDSGDALKITEGTASDGCSNGRPTS